MRQSDICGSVRNDEIFNLHLGSGDLPLSLHSLPPARHQPLKQPEKSKEQRNQIQLPTNHIILPSSTYTEPRAKRGRLGNQP